MRVLMESCLFRINMKLKAENICQQLHESVLDLLVASFMNFMSDMIVLLNGSTFSAIYEYAVL